MLTNLPIVLVALLTVQQHAKGTAGNAVSHGEWTGACTLAGELNKLQKRGAHRLTAVTVAVTSYIRQYFKTHIFLEKSNSGIYTPAQEALLQYYAEKTNEALSSVADDKVLKTATAIRDAGAAAAAIGGFIRTLDQIAALETHSCLENAQSTNNAKAKGKLGSAPAAGCEEDPGDLTDTVEATPTLTRTGYTAAGYGTKQGASSNGVGTAKCVFTKAKASNHMLNPVAGDQNIAGDPHYAGGLFYLAAGELKRRKLDNAAALDAGSIIIKRGLLAAGKLANEAKPFETKKPLATRSRHSISSNIQKDSSKGNYHTRLARR
ncbi:Trypanosome variant surface glycoprotein (A-type), putative [Trypanosoma equiperdum]|uniref:Trypanosome variant surface glycoprotein (A-type), putative n=1 Tax=Trypanosoma equiperdum TaxID=5694 RepID=A0A1G4HYJ8_TRYEQ|nr:Trypanosome variant surface glycoprotein (A-type), putative [Trypanosoma equiperdum]